MKNKSMCFVLTFSFLLMLPLQVSAAETDLTKEVTLTVSEYDEAEKQAEEQFAQKMKENGKSYELSDIEYTVLSTEYLDKKKNQLN